MTPLQIEMLLHYYTRTTDYPDLSSPAQTQAMGYFIEHGYLEQRPLNVLTPHGASAYAPTTKLHAYCEALCRVPEPRQEWVVDMGVKS